MPPVTTCAPPFETVAETVAHTGANTGVGTAHWLADRQGNLWVLRWRGGQWYLGAVNHGDGVAMFQQGWRYIGRCHRADISNNEISHLDALTERSALTYRDNRQPERSCEHCGQPYRGPAIYCCLPCALADA